MKKLKQLIVFALCISLFNACSKEEDVIEVNTPPVGLKSNIEVKIAGEESLFFDFDECAFNDSQKQRATNGFGTYLNTLNKRSLGTRIYNRNEAQEIVTQLILKAEFTNEISDGPIDLALMDSLFSTHLIPTASPSFSLEFIIERDDRYYTNSGVNFEESGQVMCSYAEGFEMEIKEYEMNFQSECSEDEFVRIKADFKGTLYDYQGTLYDFTEGVAVDSIHVEVVDLELLFKLN